MSRQRVVNGKNTRGGLKRFTISMQNKLVVLFAIVLLAFVGLGVRLFLINRDNGQTYSMQVLSQQAYENQTIPFKRGRILDCKGTVLADSQLVYNRRMYIWSPRSTRLRALASIETASRNTSPITPHRSIISR